MEDGETIKEMIVPLTTAEATTRSLIYGIGLPGGQDGRPGQHYFCARWNPETGRCTRYAERPRMCSEFPYEQTCGHCGGRLLPGPTPLIVLAEAEV